MVNMKINFLVLHLTVGLSYQQGCRDGAEINDGCIKERCIGGIWIPDKDTILSHCKKCNAWGDPHFETFSGARFDWHDPCNYALVQESSSKNPDFGVFMTFDRKDDVAYIGTPTTYQDDIHTKVVIHEKDQLKFFNVEVNGVKQLVTQYDATLLHGKGSIPTSVYAWKHHSRHDHTLITNSECLMLYGKSKILIELCESAITIWAPPTDRVYPFTLAGLCGSTASKALQDKKLVGRDHTPYPNPGDWNDLPEHRFATSWRTTEQTSSSCPMSGKRKRSPRELTSIEDLHQTCVLEAKRINGLHHDKCFDVHKGKGQIGDDHLAACKYDLCHVVNGTEHKKFGLTIDWILTQHIEIHLRRNLHMVNTLDFVPVGPVCRYGCGGNGECTDLNHCTCSDGYTGNSCETQITQQPQRFPISTQRPSFPPPPQPVITPPPDDCKCVKFYDCGDPLPEDPKNRKPGDFLGLIDERTGNAVIDIHNGQCEALKICCKSVKTKFSPVHVDPVIVPIPELQKQWQCGKRQADGVRVVVNGFADGQTQLGEFPWMVAVLDKDTTFIGGGSLVHPRVVLTAGHKVYQRAPGSLVARIGDWDISKQEEHIDPQSIDIEKILYHPNFNRQTLVYNVAILILKAEAKYGETVAPVCLPEPGQNFDGKDCFVTGWSKDYLGRGDYQTIMKKVSVPIVDHSKCQTQLRRTRLGSNFNLHSSFTCAGGHKEDACTGDGGSPLVCPGVTNTKELVQVGVVSWGIGCGVEGNPGVYGSVPESVNWITQTIHEEFWIDADVRRG